MKTIIALAVAVATLSSSGCIWPVEEGGRGQGGRDHGQSSQGNDGRHDHGDRGDHDRGDHQRYGD